MTFSIKTLSIKTLCKALLTITLYSKKDINTTLFSISNSIIQNMNI